MPKYGACVNWDIPTHQTEIDGSLVHPLLKGLKFAINQWCERGNHVNYTHDDHTDAQDSCYLCCFHLLNTC